MSLSIQGKTAIVTGAGRGIGLAVARHFVERGAHVMFADTDEAALAEAMSDYDERDPHVRGFSGRMSEKLATANLLSATLDAFDRVDILVNAHRLVKASDPLDTDLDVLEQLLRQNMMAGLRMTQIVAKRMIKQAEADPETGAAGAIVNISTLAALHPVPTMLGYSIAYAAQEQATRGMALALAPHRIRVNGVRFGSVMSHELKDSLRDKPDLRSKIVAATPMGRIAAADELVDTVLYLASEASRFVTGQIVTVDGGRSLSDRVAVQTV
ncbi:3-oxoacyl-[acyl-carrier-protein] reductase FabG [Paracoccus haematequi]|uniref:3-oxoacyl-[acyl-carrier-protein] reductase FabG n=1 Tax=Paracoccus haematequi TaxID=2491866 RepID=A0A447INF2_9RHOB|nr:SDR family oxidoreductase [Paracoccus haematequi]VDS09062.1 3-oxoacyl-[acyl-carrier-protein] reductase FabG [Paracoccus haematequi]